MKAISCTGGKLRVRTHLTPRPETTLATEQGIVEKYKAACRNVCSIF